jgi:hypothetical protein
MYTSSVEQWRHYAEELAPLRDWLVAGGIVLDDSASPVNASE